jgi:hypothetical protein
LGGAAVHRCDSRPFSTPALATEVREKDGTGKLQPRKGATDNSPARKCWVGKEANYAPEGRNHHESMTESQSNEK